MSSSIAPETRVGEVIGGRYELVSLVGSGGQGHVYKAHDKKDGEVVAIKVLRHEFSHDSAWRERMFREARALSLLSNTAAVRVYDQRWTDDGAICIIMEYLEGKHFEDYLAVVESWGERLGMETLVRLIGPVVDCLELAHANYILHRDIKPGNLFVRRDESVRLLDFGFAKFLHLTRMTARGFVAGSPSYIAPESWQRAPKIFDQRVDVYGLAAVIFRALAGRPPFLGDLAELAEAVTQGPRPSLHALRPELPVEVDDWVNHALAVDPVDRFERVSGMWQAFLHSVRWEQR